MPGRVEQNPDVFLRLNVSQDRTGGDSPAHCLVQVGHRDVEMLGCVLSAVNGGLYRPGELLFALEIERRTVLPDRRP